MTENELSKIIVDCAFKIHTKFGPGLLESVYEAVLAHELEKEVTELPPNRQYLLFMKQLNSTLGFAPI